VIHDAIGRGEDELAKGARGEEIGCTLFELAGTDVEARGDDARLVDAAVELDDDLARAVVVDDLKLINVAMALHQGQEFDDDLRRRADEDLTLATLLGVDDGLEAVVEY